MLRPMKRILTFSVILLMFASKSFGEQLPKITFTPHWLPQAQFAGYYVAEKMGFYAEEGIDVNIVHPSASTNAIELLASGESDIISLFLITAINAKQQGPDIVNIAQMSQNSALMFISKKEKQINKLSDLNKKKISVWESGFGEVGEEMVRSNNLTVEWVPILSSINMFLVGGIDAMTAMSFNEYYQIINSGLNEDELNIFSFADYGYNIPEDGLYCQNKTRLSKENELRKFVKATLKGWEYAKEHKTEALDIVLEIMKKEHIATNRSHQSWMLNKVLELIEPGSKNVKKGELSEPDFYKTQSILINGKYVENKIDFNDFYKPISGN